MIRRTPGPLSLNALNCACLAFILFAAAPVRAQVRPVSAPSEYELKAMFFVTLARYTQWPTNSFANPNDPLVIGVFGHNPFGNKLDSLVTREQVQGHPLQVLVSPDIDALKSCQM